jgi:demethylmenaquinone methyltransferase/2-methoxy-6-polyprenyl-1,4-benzoquinol methylase
LFSRLVTQNVICRLCIGWFEVAGLKEYTAQTFIGSIQVSLTDEQRKALISLFDMRWGTPKSELSENDWNKFQRLCHPDSPDLILNCSDYYGLLQTPRSMAKLHNEIYGRILMG